MQTAVSLQATSLAQSQRTPVFPAPTHDAPDAAIEERVHAWYQARTAAEAATAARAAAAASSNTLADSLTAGSPSAFSKTSTSGNALTVEDSSTQDDAAAIREESHIPSTAPTERVPAPFTHGDLLAGAAPVASSAFHPHVAAPPAALAGAPSTLRSPASAAKAVAAASAKPKLDPELSDTLAREAFDDSDAVGGGRSAAALVGSTANTKLATRPGTAVLGDAPALGGDLFNVSGALLPPMRGSHTILVHQNQMAVADGLLRIANDTQLADMQRHRLLVALPDTASMQPDGRLPLNRRYARPWTVHFLDDLARAHYARFGTPLVITSAVRTVAFQRRLVLTNGNAAPPTGDIASPHLYGQAVDLAKHGMSVTEIAWMRAYLTPVESEGKIDVEEEFLQSCFHISVYRRYAPQPAGREMPAEEEAPSRKLQQARAVPAKRRRISTALLAAGLR